MAMNIKSPEAEALARKVAAATGESLTGAIVVSLRERWERIERQNQEHSLTDQLEAIARRCAALPLLDPRTPEEATISAGPTCQRKKESSYRRTDVSPLVAG